MKTEAFNDSLRHFVSLTRKVPDCTGYVPMLYVPMPQEEFFVALTGPLGSHDEFLKVAEGAGVFFFDERKFWPDAVFIAGENETGISIWGCTSDARTNAAALEYLPTGIEINLLEYKPGEEEPVKLNRNPAAHFYKNGPLALHSEI